MSVSNLDKLKAIASIPKHGKPPEDFMVKWGGVLQGENAYFRKYGNEPDRLFARSRFVTTFYLLHEALSLAGASKEDTSTALDFALFCDANNLEFPTFLAQGFSTGEGAAHKRRIAPFSASVALSYLVMELARSSHDPDKHKHAVKKAADSLSLLESSVTPDLFDLATSMTKENAGGIVVTNQEEIDRMREVARTFHELAVQIYQVIVQEDVEPASFEANIHDAQRDLNSLQAIIDNNKAE